MNDLVITSAPKSLVRPDLRSAAWTAWERAVFRLGFVYFVIQAFPLDWKYFRLLFSLHWSSVHFQDLFRLTTYSPEFLSRENLPQWGPGSFANWGIALAIAIAVSLTWGALDRTKREYNNGYYWLRVLLRFRLSIGVIAYGIIKCFHVQIPYPALSDLNTAYGDFLPWKIYYLTTGASTAAYEQTLGLLEITGALLLLHRRTTLIGTALITAILTNIVAANFAYRIGQHVYSTYLLVIALFLLLNDIPRLYSLLVARRLALPDRSAPVIPVLTGSRRLLLKGLFVLFALVLASLTIRDSHQDRWPYPGKNGLPGVSGYYNVKEFQLNGKILPYSLSDTIRWRNVVFEKWNTFSVATGYPVAADLSRPVVDYDPDRTRDYESAGNAGRQYFSYSGDTTQGIFSARSKNGRETIFSFHYQLTGDSLLILSGRNGNSDSLHILLEKIDKKYLLIEGRRIPRKI